MIIHRTFAAAVAILALAVPAAAQAQQDLRSPDTRDAASAITAPKQDLRSPDARDAVNSGAGTVRSIPPASEPAARVVGGGEGGGVHWGTIALGLVPSVLVVVGLAALMGRRSRRASRVGSTA